jgi:hypothetical protein
MCACVCVYMSLHGRQVEGLQEKREAAAAQGASVKAAADMAAKAQQQQLTAAAGLLAGPLKPGRLSVR